MKKVVRNTPAGGTFSKNAPPSGMLKVQRCVPGSPAASALQPGDLLLELAGKSCVDFVLFVLAVDCAVGRRIPLSVCRGGKRIEVVIEVLDLHRLVPHSFMALDMALHRSKVPNVDELCLRSTGKLFFPRGALEAFSANLLCSRTAQASRPVSKI